MNMQPNSIKSPATLTPISNLNSLSGSISRETLVTEKKEPRVSIRLTSKANSDSAKLPESCERILRIASHPLISLELDVEDTAKETNNHPKIASTNDQNLIQRPLVKTASDELKPIIIDFTNAKQHLEYSIPLVRTASDEL
jgi:hypothetical protein